MEPTGAVTIIDFGSQYTQLIARRIREMRVFSRIQSCRESVESIASHSPSAIILSGGPSSVYDEGAPELDRRILELGVPVLGICYGMQAMARVAGGEVIGCEEREYGPASLGVTDEGDLFVGWEGGEDRQVVWMSHGDLVKGLPAGFTPMASTRTTPIAAFGNRSRRLYGVQFHPEVVHSRQGRLVLENFLFGISRIEPTWTMADYIGRSVDEIRSRVGEGRVLCGLSGGVDSSVAALMVQRAIGERLTCVFVDNGLLRENERREVEMLFRGRFHLNLVVEDATDRFLNALAGVSDPETKRKIIGREFIEVFSDVARRLGPFQHLAQGTLYPDVIESVSAKGGPSATIKSHHNVGGLPDDLQFSLVEPLRELFKDEVRQLGRELGLPEEIVSRQPFPGPGLAVRLLGPVGADDLAILRRADAIVREEFEASGWDRQVWQSFAVLLPIRTVGVMGDGRTYEKVIALRVVSSQDGMTADWVRLPYDLLAAVSSRIINEVAGVNRVVYDISSKPPSTIEWE
jgi:GMP synthase (glutamine-hydrolysing)